MRHALAALILLGLGAVPLHGQRPVVTVAPRGIVRVARPITLRIPEGRSRHRIELGDAIVASVVSGTPGIEVIEVVRGVQFDEAEALRRGVGHEFDVRNEDGTTVRRRLLGVDPERWSDPSGSIFIMRPGVILWPDSLLATFSGLDIVFESDRARTGLIVEYEVGGGLWTAVYDLRLGAPGSFAGRALLATGSLGIESATTRLTAGDLGASAGPLPRLPIGVYGYGAQGGVAGGISTRAQNIQGSYTDGLPMQPTMLAGQIYFYELPDPVEFVPNREIAVTLLDRTAVTPVRRLSIGGAVPSQGEVPRHTGSLPVPVEVTYDLPRERGSALGDLPIPAGVVSVYETAPDGSAQLIGRSSLRHSPPGSPLQVHLGASFDVSATRSQTSYQVERTGDDGRAMGAVIGFREEIINAGDTAVTVTTYETRSGEWEMLESSHPTERLESGAIAIPVRIPARGRVVVTYRLRLSW